MARPLLVIHTVSSTSYLGLAAPVMTLLLCAFALLMCASHSRKWGHWSSSCCDAYAEDPVIEANNEAAMTNADLQEAASSLWQKNILMGGKCQLPDFSGVIIYDSNGYVVTTDKNSRQLVTWK